MKIFLLVASNNDHPTISCDWNQLFSPKPLWRNKQTTDQRLDPTFCLCLCFCSKGTSKQFELLATQKKQKKSNPQCLSENQTECLSKKQMIESNFSFFPWLFLYVKTAHEEGKVVEFEETTSFKEIGPNTQRKNVRFGETFLLDSRH